MKLGTEKRVPIAKLYKFNGGPEECLAIDTVAGKKVWFYENGVIDIQGENWPDNPTREFFTGDEITIKF